MEDWSLSRVHASYFSGEWKTALTSLITGNAEREVKARNKKLNRLIELLLYGDDSQPPSLLWSISSTSLTIYKSLYGQYGSQPLLQSREVTKEEIQWLFAFLYSNSEEITVLIRANALSTVLLLIKTKKLSQHLLELIAEQLRRTVEDYLIPATKKENDNLLLLSLKTSVAPKSSSNPLTLITSQLQEILQLLKLKYEETFSEIIKKEMKEDPSLMMELLQITFDPFTKALEKEKKHSNSEEDDEQEEVISFMNNYQDKFYIHICSLFSLILEFLFSSSSSSSTSSVATSLSGKLHNFDVQQSLLFTIIEYVDRSTIIHDVYHSCFYYLLLVILNNSVIPSSPSSVSKLVSSGYELILEKIRNLSFVSCPSVVSVKKVDIFIGFLVSFYDDITYPLLEKLISKTNDLVEVSENVENYSISSFQEMISSTVRMIMNLQQKMKDFQKYLLSSAKQLEKEGEISSDYCKDIKMTFSEIRKGCISCCEHMFQKEIGKEWILQNQEIYWKLSISSLMTPLLWL
jgi:hypothetical protein